jgi:kinesin family member 6/9
MATAATESEALNYLFRAEVTRATGGHDLNVESTRSHCVFTLHMTSRRMRRSEAKCYGLTRWPPPAARTVGDPDDKNVITAKLHIVDLAGSERIFKTGSTGLLQKEAAYINKSLSFLEQVRLGR